MDNATLRTDAAAIKQGDSLNSGHYYALTRATNGWLKRDDTECTLEKRFISNLRGAYYVLITKT